MEETLGRVLKERASLKVLRKDLIRAVLLSKFKQYNSEKYCRLRKKLNNT